MEGHPLSAVRDCLFNVFAATTPPPSTHTHTTGGRSSIRNLRTSHAVVTGTHLTRDSNVQCVQMKGEGRQSHLRFVLYYYVTLMRNMVRLKHSKPSVPSKSHLVNYVDELLRSQLQGVGNWDILNIVVFYDTTLCWLDMYQNTLHHICILYRVFQ
jgi:hypothetical protein